MKRGFLIILFIALTSSVYSIGIGPSVKEINFNPNLKLMDYIEVVNSADYDVELSLQLSGDLSKYLTLEKSKLFLSRRGSAVVEYSISLPDSIEKPGLHIIEIKAIEGSVQGASSTAGIAARTSATSYIKIFVPYPGKYAEMSFTVNNANVNEPVIFDILIKNLGKENIEKAEAIVDIYNKGDKNKIESIKTESKSIPIEQELILKAVYSDTVKPGIYSANIFLNYDGKILNGSEDFKIGSLSVDITNYTKKLKKDAINPFDVEIESRWNSKIDNIYGEVELYKDETKLTMPSKTASTFLNEWEKKIITAYIDTNGFESGKYKAKISLYYLDKKTEKMVDVSIVKKLELNNTILLIGLVVLILIIDVLWLILSKRKKRK